MHGPLRNITCRNGWHWLFASRCRRLPLAARRGNVFVAGLARVQPKASTRLNSCESSYPKRPAFTLIELLITVTIIGLLSAVVMGALQSARETAKVAKTKATITKLHFIIMARYDSYRTRRVPVDIKQYVSDNSGPGGLYDASDASKPHGLRALAHARLMAIRDMMRMEMPDRLSNLSELKPKALVSLPSITARYNRIYGAGAEKENCSAEMLYMIVMSIPEAAEQISNMEIGDTDGDGHQEFVDGWGHPIKFLRWPVGFLPDGSTVGTVTVNHGAITDLQDLDTKDPFDPVGVTNSFATFPLIYSAGPDGVYDINTGWQHEYLYCKGDLNPFAPDTNGYLVGQPLHLAEDGSPAEAPDPGNLHHQDNIHNHMLEVR